MSLCGFFVHISQTSLQLHRLNKQVNLCQSDNTGVSLLRLIALHTFCLPQAFMPHIRRNFSVPVNILDQALLIVAAAIWLVFALPWAGCFMTRFPHYQASAIKVSGTACFSFLIAIYLDVKAALSPPPFGGLLWVSLHRLHVGTPGPRTSWLADAGLQTAPTSS